LPIAEIIKRVERTCREITAILPLVNPIDSLSAPPVQPGVLAPASLPQDERVLNGAKTLLEHEAQVLIDLIDALVEKENE
jgi:hypothetical protein